MKNGRYKMELENGELVIWKFERAFPTYQAMAIMMQMPDSIKELEAAIHKMISSQLKKTTMQPEQLIKEISRLAEERNLKEEFYNDRGQEKEHKKEKISESTEIRKKTSQ